MELLVGRRANVHAKDVDGRTPLHGSIVRGARACDVARILLTVGADPNAPDEFGYTPLHIAALNEFSACVLLLLGKLFSMFPFVSKFFKRPEAHCIYFELILLAELSF